MNELIREFDLNILKADHVLEMAIDKYLIATNESLMIYESNNLSERFISEAFYKENTTLLGAIGNFFKKIYESIASFCKKIVERIKVKIQTAQIKSRLKVIKNELIKNKAVNNQPVSVLDNIKYTAAYNKWISWEINGVDKILNGNYNTQEELSEAIASFEKESEEYLEKIKLNDKDAYIIETNIGKAINYTENQIDNIERLNNLPGAWEDSVKKLENAIKGEPDTSKIGWIKRETIKISNISKMVITTITVSLITTISVIVMAINKIKDPNNVLSVV